LTRRIPL